MKHFILTIFNEIFPDIDSYGLQDNNLGINDDWLRQRLDVFFRITDKSIRLQTNKNFVWLVKCSYKTPQWARQELSKSCAILDYSEPLWRVLNEQRLYESVYEHKINSNRVLSKYAFQKSIKLEITTPEEVITTRLDSDDGLASDYVNLVQQRAKLGRFIDFCNGLILKEKSLFVYNRHQRHPSQFCSYKELVTNKVKTVYFLHHILANPCDYYDELGWVQTNHTFNLNNHKTRLFKEYQGNKAGFMFL